jgi:hypothetical protein
MYHLRDTISIILYYLSCMTYQHFVYTYFFLTTCTDKVLKSLLPVNYT